MAASIIQPDHTLEDRIYILQKSKLTPDARGILEEAARLLGDGRQTEALALVDKAEAVSSSASNYETGHIGASTPSGEPGAPNVGKPLAAQLATDIADGLSKVLVGAIENLERHIAGETRGLTSALSERLDKIQSTVECLQPLTQQLDSLVQAGTAVEAKYEQLVAITASLQEAHFRRDAEIGDLRQQVQDLSASASDRINEICHRLEEQERQISTANSTTSELAVRIAAAAERLERHAGAVRALHQDRQQRSAALDQVAELLGRLRTPAETQEAIADL